MEVQYTVDQQQQKYKKLKVIQYLAIQQMMVTGDPDCSDMVFLFGGDGTIDYFNSTYYIQQ